MLVGSLHWGGQCVVDYHPNTRVSDATAVTFSVKCFNPSSESGLLHTFVFIHEQVIIMRFPTVNLIAVTTLLLTSGLRRCSWKRMV